MRHFIFILKQLKPNIAFYKQQYKLFDILIHYFHKSIMQIILLNNPSDFETRIFWFYRPVFTL